MTWHHFHGFLLHESTTQMLASNPYEIKLTVKTLNIGTPRPATVVVLNIKPFNFTMK